MPRPIAALAIGSASLASACDGGGACATMAIGAAVGAGLAWQFVRMVRGAERRQFSSQRAREMKDYLEGQGSPQSPLDDKTAEMLTALSAHRDSSDHKPTAVRSSINIVIPRMQIEIPFRRPGQADGRAFENAIKRLPEMLQGVDVAMRSRDGKPKTFS